VNDVCRRAVREHSRIRLGVGGDLDRLKEDFRLVGKHLTNAAAAHAAAERRIERLGGKLAAIGGEEPVEEGPRQALLLRSS